jgi:hypothetical protein
VVTNFADVVLPHLGRQVASAGWPDGGHRRLGEGVVRHVIPPPGAVWQPAAGSPTGSFDSRFDSWGRAPDREEKFRRVRP